MLNVPTILSQRMQEQGLVKKPRLFARNKNIDLDSVHKMRTAWLLHEKIYDMIVMRQLAIEEIERLEGN